jgi:hypothetical protein
LGLTADLIWMLGDSCSLFKEGIESVYGDFGLQLVNKKRLIKSLLKDETMAEHDELGVSLIT